MSTTNVTQEPKTEKYVGEPGDEERFSHYARKEAIDNAILDRKSVV